MEKFTVKEFTDMVVNELKNSMVGITIKTEEVTKNNGVKLHAVSIHSKQCNMAPCVYLDDYYKEYVNGNLDLHDIVDKIISISKETALKNNFNVALITEYSNASIHLRGKLINTEMNKELLETVPHREFLDLSLVYCVCFSLEELEGKCSIQVKNEHMDIWGVTENTLYLQLIDNMKANNEVSINSMKSVLCGQLGCNEELVPLDLEQDGPQMYVFTNKRGSYGAVEILREDSLRNFSDRMNRDFILLPSSIHEWLLIPVDETFKSEDLKQITQMVKEVNDNHVTPNELLSYHVYKYERKTGKVTIAA